MEVSRGLFLKFCAIWSDAQVVLSNRYIYTLLFISALFSPIAEKTMIIFSMSLSSRICKTSNSSGSDINVLFSFCMVPRRAGWFNILLYRSRVLLNASIHVRMCTCAIHVGRRTHTLFWEATLVAREAWKGKNSSLALRSISQQQDGRGLQEVSKLPFCQVYEFQRDYINMVIFHSGKTPG